jgi:hypothetical protein
MSSQVKSMSESVVANTPARPDRSGRAQALVSWAAAVLLLSLILWLSGALPLGALDDVLSIGTAASALVVFVLISGEVRGASRGPASRSSWGSPV